MLLHFVSIWSLHIPIAISNPIRRNEYELSAPNPNTRQII